MEHSAGFHFYGTLNDFFSVDKKEKSIRYSFNENPAVKDAIEALGVPHTEVNVVAVNGAAVNFFYHLHNYDEVEVYPANFITSYNAGSLIPAYSYPIRFIADVHVGKLAKALRITGFDTLYENNYSDKEIAAIAEAQQRIILTRNKRLLKQTTVKWGYWLRSNQPEDQLTEVIKRYNLQDKIQPFTRCLECNGMIEPVTKNMVTDKLPVNTERFFHEFYQCTNCKKLYWKGSHYERMMGNLSKIKMQTL